ncbi:MAG TPA: cyclic nucleotide-binding domain-containing protein [Candidatus Limnocylindria bacterium]|jgi:CRP-like cAMP-binding protein|nr:cyclic nucleotide-binding domain-containing protein [Candidatus Limnocylindria bacterium]
MEEPMDPKRAANIPLLAVLDRRGLDNVLRTAREQTYAPGDVVVAQGDPATRLFIIVSGTAAVEQEDQGRVGTLGEGEFFGELALIEAHGRTATVRADSELTCLVIPAWEFKASLEEHPKMAIPMLETIISRLHRREHHVS